MNSADGTRLAVYAAGPVAAPLVLLVPVLVLHGAEDRVVDRDAATHHVASIPGAKADWWAGIGHLPFAEDPGRFNSTLLRFARHCAARHRAADRERMSR
ncbi:MAG TPA: hypothetical protein VGJ95_18430 [Pseudonocardiaceae bacterium]